MKEAPVTPRHILHELYFLAAALLAVSAYGQDSLLMTYIVAANLVLRFALIGRRGDWIYLLLGIIGGGGNDLMSMIKGVYFYTPKNFLPIPLPVFMFLFWGHTFVALRQLFLYTPMRGPGIEGKPWRLDKRLIADIIVVVAFRIIVYNWVHKEPIPTIAFAAVLALRLLFIFPKKHEWLLMAAVMVIGPAFEACLIRFGLYVYYNPFLLGMPAWLLIYWAFIIPIFLKGISDRIEAGRETK